MKSFFQADVPKTITCLREGYRFKVFTADLIAGLTVAIVALPLAMAFAIASGASPAQGLYTAIIAGFIISAFGGVATRSVARRAPLWSSSTPLSCVTATMACCWQP
nr:SulP family inorganic anion transporter [Desulfurispirillum indicum]